MRILRNLFFTIVFLTMSVGKAFGQFDTENKAFKAGEELVYDLYFHWKFVWVKVGAASLKTVSARYQGKDALKSDLLFTGNDKLQSVFTMKDTLRSYITPQLVPLYFRKGAVEGKRYTVDEVFYSYPNGKSKAELHHRNKHGEWSENTSYSDECNYDMLSILLRARSFDASNYKEGQRIHFLMATGKKVEKQTLIYKGKENFKANDDVTYRCMVFSLLDYDEKKKEKELLRFYVTDDANHLPMRIDFYLRFGTAKAYFKSAKNLRNSHGAIVKKK